MIDESERLNRFIANLLDMTRLESGAIVPMISADSGKRDRHKRYSGKAAAGCARVKGIGDDLDERRQRVRVQA